VEMEGGSTSAETIISNGKRPRKIPEA